MTWISVKALINVGFAVLLLYGRRVFLPLIHLWLPSLADDTTITTAIGQLVILLTFVIGQFVQWQREKRNHEWEVNQRGVEQRERSHIIDKTHAIEANLAENTQLTKRAATESAQANQAVTKIIEEATKHFDEEATKRLMEAMNRHALSGQAKEKSAEGSSEG